VRVVHSAMLWSRREETQRLLLYVALVLVSVIWQLRPYNDPDFFWHLKNGEWISQHRELPTQDPFNYTSGVVEPARQRFVLTSYWLSEVIYAAVDGLMGFPGTVALKFLVALPFLLVLLKLRRGDPVVHAALMLCFLLMFYRFYYLDRPQAFSFLFFAALLVLLEKERTRAAAPSRWRSFLPIPILMLFWANMHGGHTVGQVLIVTYVALEGVKFLHPALQPAGPERYRRLLIVGGAGLLASLANPNSYHVLQLALTQAQDANFAGNAELASSVLFYSKTRAPEIFIFWAALVLAAAYCLTTIAKPDITQIVLLAGTGYEGFSHMRFVPFFMIAALPAIGLLLSAEWVRRWTRPLLVVGAVVLVAYFSRGVFPSREFVSRALRVNGDSNPIAAADFVLANDLKGNLFNTYAWGGYLIWRLGPERKVYVDGRGINPKSMFDVKWVCLAVELPGSSEPYWKSVLRQNGVGYLIIPRPQRRADIISEDTSGFIKALLEDPEWFPVFADTTALVFVLNRPEHRDVIARHGLAKDRPLGWWLRADFPG